MNTSQSNGGKEMKDEAISGAHRVVDNVEDKADAAGEKLDEYKESAKNMMHEINDTSMADVEKKIKTRIRENPTSSLLGAAAAGFVVGLLLCRR